MADTPPVGYDPTWIKAGMALMALLWSIITILTGIIWNSTVGRIKKVEDMVPLLQKELRDGDSAVIKKLEDSGVILAQTRETMIRLDERSQNMEANVERIATLLEHQNIIHPRFPNAKGGG